MNEEKLDYFRCPQCGRVSYHPDDIKQGYCGHCNDWTGEKNNGWAVPK